MSFIFFSQFSADPLLQPRLNSPVKEHYGPVLLNGKLAREHNSKTTPMGGEISAGDLLTIRKLKNTDMSFTYRPTEHTKRSAN